MNRFIIGLIIFGLLCVSVGAVAGVLFENTYLNNKIEQKLITISESDTPLFRIGNETFRIEKYDTTIRTP